MNEIMMRIFSLCLQLSEIGVDAFCQYYPHLQAINVQVYAHGWSKEKHPDITFTPCRIGTNTHETEQAKRCIEYLEDLYNAGRQ